MKLRVINPAFIEAMKKRGIDLPKRFAGGNALRIRVRPVPRGILLWAEDVLVVFPWD